MLTAVVPLDLKRRPKDLMNKVRMIANQAEEYHFHIVIGHNDRGSKYDSELKKSLINLKYVRIKSVKLSDDNINSSRLRNIAFELVETEYMVLLDADIYIEFNVLESCKDRIKKGLKPFYIIPCLYLTKYGTSKLISGDLSPSDLKNKYFDFSRKEFLHLASPSSIVVLKTRDYKSINGFSTEYQGHGYEDFDFLVKLSIYYSLLTITTDFFEDKTARSPLFVVGFRRYLGDICLDALLDKVMLFHLYHDKDNKELYYKSRNENYNLFYRKYNHLSQGENIQIGDNTLIKKFVTLCNNNGMSVHDYSIFFENKPGYIDRYDSFIKKVRFIFNG